MSNVYDCWRLPNSRWQHPHNITHLPDTNYVKSSRTICGVKCASSCVCFSRSICLVEFFFLVVCASTFENCTNLFYVNMYNIAQDRIHAQYFNKIIITYCVGRGKKRYGRVCRRLYAENSSATHDLENAVSAYRVSAKQRLENQRLEQPIRKKSYLL